MPDGSAAWLIQHNKPQPGRHHALIAHGLVVADRLPLSDLATRPAIGWGPTFTHHAIVLGDRHGRSLLTEGGQPMPQRGPVDEGVVVNIRLWADLRAPPRQLGDYGAGAAVSLPVKPHHDHLIGRDGGRAAGAQSLSEGRACLHGTVLIIAD